MSACQGALNTSSLSDHAAAATQLRPAAPGCAPVAAAPEGLTTKSCRGLTVPVRSLQVATSRPQSVWVVVIRPSLQTHAEGKMNILHMMVKQRVGYACEVFAGGKQPAAVSVGRGDQAIPAHKSEGRKSTTHAGLSCLLRSMPFFLRMVAAAGPEVRGWAGGCGWRLGRVTTMHSHTSHMNVLLHAGLCCMSQSHRLRTQSNDRTSPPP